MELTVVVKVKECFRDEDLCGYDFSQAPSLVKLRSQYKVSGLTEYGKLLSTWEKEQHSFMDWTKDGVIFSEKYIREGKELVEPLFTGDQMLSGSVLDIGGGWGLYRQWWRPEANDVYIVHDPGVERFLAGPHEFHYVCYERAFSLPSTFVEGFGESLPYRDKTFDTCLIASALDHCLKPGKVIKEAYRCLKSDGNLVVIQQCEKSVENSRSFSVLLAKLIRALRSPIKLLRMIYSGLLYHGDSHITHFTVNDLTEILIDAGFSKDIEVRRLPLGHYQFRARKQ